MSTPDTTGSTGDGTARTPWPALAACVLVGAFFLWVPPVIRFQLDGGQEILFWREALVLRLRWLLIALALALSAFTVFLCRRSSADPSSIGRRLAPVALLPLFACLALLGDRLPLPVTSNLMLLGPVLVITLVVSRWLEAALERAHNAAPPREWTLPLFALSLLLYLAVGLTLALVTGEHVGDEGHYLIQARSLHDDHDLDIKNNVIDKEGEYAHDYDLGKGLLKEAAKRKLSTIEELLAHVHISSRSLDGHWYSHHPFGLSVLLAPFWGLGLFPRYLILALIGALGNVGLYRIGRRLGAGPGASLLATAGFGLSIYWIVYNARVLPEALGAVLLLWAFWGVLAQPDRPWRTVLVTALCCGALPFAHDRFLAMGLMAFGFYGLFGLFGSELWWPKCRRLAAFTALTFAGFGLYALCMSLMFHKGLKYTIENTILSFPLGMWGAVADWRGVTAVLPVFPWMAAAGLLMLGLPGLPARNRNFAAASAVTFGICLLIACSNGIYVGGKCLPGRYALVAVPLFVPLAAVALQRCDAVARGWFVFLSLASTAILVAILVLLPAIGRGFIFPITNLQQTHPALAGLLNPHASFMYPNPWTAGHTATTVWVAGSIVLTPVVILLPRRLRALAGLLVLLLAGGAVAAHVAQAHPRPVSSGTDTLLPKYLSRISLDRAVAPRPLATPTNLLDISRLTYRDFLFATSAVGVTTADLGTRMVGNQVSQPRLEKNDWAGRGLAWRTLTAPHTPYVGHQILHVAGELTGDAQPMIALRQGSTTLYEGPLPVADGKAGADFTFRCRRFGGHLYILLRLADGEGSFVLKELYSSPYGPGLVENTGIRLPKPLISTEKEAR